uniref:Uncharacterized protein n=1 Tax=Arundo donax TaxID=35708 RepID=A0A0A8XT49_ARUDO
MLDRAGSRPRVGQLRRIR